MNIIIVGATHVGLTLAENLVLEKNDVTLIDKDASILRKIESKLDIKTICGMGSHPDVLKIASANDADMLIAVSESDEVNMMACQVAYSLFKTPKKIARIQTASYLNTKKLFADELIPVDFSINPEQLITKYISRLVARPGALQVWDFYKNKIQLVSLRPKAGGRLLGKALSTVHKDLGNIQTHIAAIFRENKPIELSDETVIQENDEVFFIAASKEIISVMKSLDRIEKRNKRIMIAGGGNIGKLVSETLESKYEVKVVESSLARSKEIASKLKHSIVLYGDATDSELLLSENIDQVDVFLALTNDDEDNIMACLQAKKLGAKKVMALVARTIYAELIDGKGIDVIISPQNAAINSILSHIRQGDIINVYSIRKGGSEAIEVVIHGDKSTSNIIGRTLGEVNMPEGVSIGAVVREDQVFYPNANQAFKAGDHVIVFLADKKQLRSLEALLQVKVTFL